MITLYLDMDGVLCNFDKAYRQLDPEKTDRKKFRESVFIHKIFEDLEFMPDAHVLLNYVSTLQDVNIEMLTSMGTFDPSQGMEAQRQKLVWLNKHNITYKPNFVRSKEEKSKFAHDRAILVDDSVGCVKPFLLTGGHGILHKNAADTVQELHELIRGIRGVYALKFGFDSMGTYA